MSDDYYYDHSEEVSKYRRLCRSRYKSHVEKNVDTKEICRGMLSLYTYDKVPIRKLLIANIPQNASHKEIKRLFSTVGKVEDCILIKKKSGLKSYAFVTYETVDTAQKAIMQGYRRDFRLGGQYLRVVPANCWSQPDSLDKKKFIPKENDINKDDEHEENIPGIVYTYDPTKSDVTIDCLNDDCLENIFKFLPLIDKVRIERVCKRWQAAAVRSWVLTEKIDLEISTWGIETTKFDDRIRMKAEAGLKTPMIYQILRRCGHYITQVDLSNKSDNIGTSAVIIITKLCPNIRLINLHGLKMTEAGYKSLMKNCHHLKTLILTGERYLSDSKYSSKLFKNKKLEHLEIDSNLLWKIEKPLSKIFTTNLKELFIDNYCDSPQNLVEILSVMNNLRTLRICFEYSTPLKLSFLSNIDLPFLKKLELYCKYSEVCYDDYVSNEKICHPDLLPVMKLVNLEKLNLFNMQIVNDAFLINLIPHCQRLQELDISLCRKVTDEGILALETLRNLKILNCEKCQITNSSVIQLLKSSNNLVTLNVFRCEKINSSNLIEAAKDILKSRSNGNFLNLYINLSNIDFECKNVTVKKEFAETFPLLRIY